MFDTYHWRGCPLNDSSLERDRVALSSGEPDENAFLELLRSGRIVGIGVALDHYAYAESAGRFSGGNPYAGHADEVLVRAREILSGPPTLRSKTGAAKDGADHASALVAMLNLACPEDSDLIASALRQASDVNVEVAAIMAASTALARSAVPNQDLVDALSNIIFDVSRSTDERLDALRPFNDVESPQAAEIAARVLVDDDVHLQMHAALILATHHLATHREMIKQVVASWPDDAPYPAEFVLDALRADGNSGEIKDRL